ncbi:MAG: DUF692 family multinuclear iron-containing protein [Planctomycetota bacterium]
MVTKGEVNLDFLRRAQKLPRLGTGISTEFGARSDGLDINRLSREHSNLVHFLEVGCDLERGVDLDTLEWIQKGLPTTYHFLDVNLEESDDLPKAWLAETATLATDLKAHWLCGDAGLWHIGRRDHGHGTLMPPILCTESAAEMARGVRAIRAATGFEVLPENPPAHLYLGDLHLLDYFAQLLEQADTGMLLDVSHLCVYQKVMGFDLTDGVDGFPWERVTELHIAGGSSFDFQGRTFFEDDHGVEILEASWQLFELALARSTNLKAVAFECEHNRIDEVLPIFGRLADAFPLVAGDSP